MKGNFLNLIKIKYQKPKANSILSRKTLKRSIKTGNNLKIVNFSNFKNIWLFRKCTYAKYFIF